jgi:hypothetical protein
MKKTMKSKHDAAMKRRVCGSSGIKCTLSIRKMSVRNDRDGGCGTMTIREFPKSHGVHSHSCRQANEVLQECQEASLSRCPSHCLVSITAPGSHVPIW